MVATSKEEALYLFELGEEYDTEDFDSFEEAVDDMIEMVYDDVCFSICCERDEWLVFEDEDEARERAIEDTENLIDDIGLEGFNSNVLDVALNTIDDDYFYDNMKDSYSSYADNIENEESSDDDIYLNKLHEEMCDNGIMEEMDLEDKDDDEIEMIKSNIESEIETLKDEFVEKLCGEYDNSKEWYEENFGRDELLGVISENELYDKQEVAEYIVDIDGVAHILASYDGEEHEQDGYLIYRVA